MLGGMSVSSNPVDLSAFDQIRDVYSRLRGQLERVIVGQDDAVSMLLAATLCRGHVLIVGVPGLAKTLMVQTLASAMDLKFKRVQFTPDMMPSDILGTELIQEDIATGQRSLRFVPGPVFSQLLLADEINRTPPKTQAALLEAMAEQQVTVAGKTMQLEQPFIVVATQNPIEQEGTYPLPEAQLDRFMFSLWIDYPTKEDEERVVTETPRIQSQNVDRVFDCEQLLTSSAAVWEMPVSQHVVSYAVSLARATRPGDSEALELTRQYIAWGAGPRAGQYLVLGAKALAAIEGQPTPNCEHIRRVAIPVLRHRLVTNYNATGEGISAADLVTKIFAEVPEPTYAG